MKISPEGIEALRRVSTLVDEAQNQLTITCNETRGATDAALLDSIHHALSTADALARFLASMQTQSQVTAPPPLTARDRYMLGASAEIAADELPAVHQAHPAACLCELCRRERLVGAEVSAHG